MAPPPFAYVFERFPSFTQTFCVREALEMERLGAAPMLFSIHDVSDEPVHHFPEDLRRRVQVLPPYEELVEFVRRAKDDRRLPQSLVLTLRYWEERDDKGRLYEAAYIGLKLQEAGVRHVHAHFAGMGARTCWWLKQFFGCTYSFTGHANDLFCDAGLPIDLRRLVNDAALVVTVSDFTARWLREHFPKASRKIHRVYNGLDLEPIAKAADGAVKDDPPLIFSVGRLIEKKGFDDLVRACAVLRNRGVSFQCAIAGEGPLEDALRSLIAELGLEARVRLLGATAQSEVIQLLGRAAVFGLPCVTEKDGGMDNLPTVLMEAMAASLPCVSTKLAGVPEMVEDGVTGLLCEQRQPGEFAGLLEHVLTDPARAVELGKAGLDRARDQFAKEKTTAQLLELLVEYGNISAGAGLPDNATIRRALRRQKGRRFKRFLTEQRPPKKRAILPEPGGRLSYRR